MKQIPARHLTDWTDKGDWPAFPIQSEGGHATLGLSRREFFAGNLLAHLLPERPQILSDAELRKFAELSVKAADYLLEELERQREELDERRAAQAEADWLERNRQEYLKNT